MFDVIPTNGETWLICGGRDFDDRDMFNAAMGDLLRLKGCPDRVIHGAAFGADTMADGFARRMACRVSIYQPRWKEHGKAAGPIRNQQMIDEGKPNLVIAFPGGKGTADTVARARKAGIDVAEIRTA